MEKNPNLPERVCTIIENPRHQIAVHIASFWEISIKVNIGKLTLRYPVEEVLKQTKQQKINILPVGEPALVLLQNLPHHHKDPFDRLLIAEALTAKLKVLSIDPNFEPYGVSCVW
ncbi:MAG: type II toxin-antitoxin system VapC family toxin [Phycisphaerae bacterium]|nr:type II toxin-antitoxin system VapC family toxin [Saprospiraceae bacterium]